MPYLRLDIGDCIPYDKVVVYTTLINDFIVEFQIPITPYNSD